MNPTTPQTPANPLTASEVASDKVDVSPRTRIYPKADLRIRLRLAAMNQIIVDRGEVPTHFDLLNELKRRGVKSSKGTILNDLIALGRSNARMAYGRPPEPVSGEPSDF